jgi:hypothetical protein
MRIIDGTFYARNSRAGQNGIDALIERRPDRALGKKFRELLEKHEFLRSLTEFQVLLRTDHLVEDRGIGETFVCLGCLQGFRLEQNPQ